VLLALWYVGMRHSIVDSAQRLSDVGLLSIFSVCLLHGLHLKPYQDVVDGVMLQPFSLF